MYTAGPYLRLFSEPQEEFRFRYRKEGTAHGSILPKTVVNERSNLTVKLENYASSENIFIRASLYTNDNIPEPHPCNLQDVSNSGICLVSLGTNMEASFPKIAIELPTVDDISKSLENRRKSLASTVDFSGKPISVHCNKSGDFEMNIVRICFEALLKTEDKKYIQICQPIFTTPIANKGCPKTANPKILRVSRESGSYCGEDEIFLVCSRIKSDDIGIIFSDPITGWKAYASFTKNDVYHQGVIIFKTPPYDTKITENVKVIFEMEKKSDGKKSDPYPFTYEPQLLQSVDISSTPTSRTPISPLNNTQQLMQNINPDEGIERKRKKRLLDDSVKMCSSTPINNQLYYGGTESIRMMQENNVVHPSTSYTLSAGSVLNKQVKTNEEFLNNPEFFDLLDEANETFVTDIEKIILDSLHVPSDGNLTTDLPENTILENMMVERGFKPEIPIRQMYETKFENIHSILGSHSSARFSPQISQSLERPQGLDSEIPVIIKHTKKNILQQSVISNITTNIANISLEEKSEGLTNESLSVKSETSIHHSDQEQENDLEHRNSVRKGETNRDPKSQVTGNSTSLSKDNNFNASLDLKGIVENETSEEEYSFTNTERRTMEHKIMKFLQHNVKHNDQTALLCGLQFLFSAHDENGYNLLHLCILHQPRNKLLLYRLLQVASSLRVDMVNALSIDHKTPLHIAVWTKNLEMTFLLLFFGADPNIQDKNGNTVAHLAISNSLLHILKLLFGKKYLKKPNLNILNAEGLSPLHIAVKNANTVIVEFLCHTPGVDINIKDSVKGFTPLHIATEYQLQVLNLLLNQPSIDVNIQDMQGNTPLHIACRMQCEEIALKLMTSQANPLIENFEFKSKLENGMERTYGQTPFSYASGNDKLKNILSGEIYLTETIDSAKEESNSHSGDNESSPTLHFQNFLKDCDQIKFLPKYIVDELCHLLDPPNNDWKLVALYLGVDEPFINSISDLCASPTRRLLLFVQKNGMNVAELLGALEISKLTEAVHLVKSAIDVKYKTV